MTPDETTRAVLAHHNDQGAAAIETLSGTVATIVRDNGEDYAFLLVLGICQADPRIAAYAAARLLVDNARKEQP